jgi:hypothetical protein
VIEFLLQDELCRFIREITRDYLLDTRKGPQPPQVVGGFLPPKRQEGSNDDDEFCILVRIVDGEDEWVPAEMQARAIVRTVVAVRTASWDVWEGQRNTLNLMNRIQRQIYATPVLANRYRATFPVRWKAPEGDSLPIWQGEMTIPWIVPMPQEIWEVKDCGG